MGDEEADQNPTEEEFAAWLTPSQALEVLASLGPAVAARELLRRFKATRAYAAGDVSWRAGGQLQHIDRFLIPADWWGKSAGADEHFKPFWTTGALHIRDYDGYRNPIEFEFFGIRIEPDGVRAVLPAPAPIEGSVQQSNKDAKPLPGAERKRFAQLYVQLFGDQARELKALAAIRACYPDNSIGRDAFLADFRAMRGPQTPGRKRQTEK